MMTFNNVEHFCPRPIRRGSKILRTDVFQTTKYQSLDDFGKYQIRQYFLHLLTAFTCGIHLLSQVTVGGTPDHECIDKETDFSTNSSTSSCLVPTKNGSERCSSWRYDTAYYGSTIVTEWNLVCDRRWLESLAQTIYMIGVLIGSLVHGSMSDKYGRKRVLCITATIQLFLGVATAFCYNYVAYVVVRFLLGLLGASGTYLTGFVLTMEMVSPNHRTRCGFGFQVAFACGVMVVAGWGFVVRDWSILQLIYGLHGLLLIGHWWFIDESPRWLYSRGCINEAKAIVQKAMIINGQDIPLGGISEEKLGTIFSTSGAQQEEVLGVLELVRTPRLRMRTFNICFNWFANSLVYYGLSLNTGALVGNPYLLLFLISLVELPAYIITPFLVDRFGRRPIISIFMLVGGATCICAALLPKGGYMDTVQIVIIMIGKLMISGSFAVVFNYTAELFPTVVRNSAIGAGTMMASLSGALSPLIFLLDSLDTSIPSAIFGSFAMIAGFLVLLLPETLNQPIIETLQEGEDFGRGDTFFSSCLTPKGQKQNSQSPENPSDTRRNS